MSTESRHWGVRRLGWSRLPRPAFRGGMALDEALAFRRSTHRFQPRPMSLGDLGQLLWAAQGLTHGDQLRTAPSAGAVHPLRLYVADASGLSFYRPPVHRLYESHTRDVRPTLREASGGDAALTEASAVVVVAADMRATLERFGPTRGARYVYLEAGHATQNLLLQATALGLAAVPLGDFVDEWVARGTPLPEELSPIYLVPVGYPG